METYQHNREGNISQLFVDFIFLSGEEILSIVNEDSLRNDTVGTSLLGIPDPPLSLQLQYAATQHTTH